MTVTVTLSLDPTIWPNVAASYDAQARPIVERRTDMRFICFACCPCMVMVPSRDGRAVMTVCPAGHPQIAIEDGKVVGTSA